MHLDKHIQALYNLMDGMWDENMRHRESIRILKIHLQDANRKLAAMGGITTSELVEVWARRANPPDAKTLERSLEQLDWDLLEDHEARIYEDWKETQNDALDIEVQ